MHELTASQKRDFEKFVAKHYTPTPTQADLDAAIDDFAKMLDQHMYELAMREDANDQI